jgi:hypothetical protein
VSSYEELVAEERAVRDVLAAGREAELRSIPGVTHVSVGLKETGGRALSGTTAIRVYVRQKKPEGAVPQRERIPGEIDGVPTDVNVVRNFEFSFDAHRARPLRGGCSISNRIIALNPAGTKPVMEVGTYGFTATYNADHSPVLLSNWHVVMANGARLGEPVFQPSPTSVGDMDPADLPYRPPDKTDAIAYITASLPWFLNEEEIPFSGTSVGRAYQRTRWYDGRTYVWIGRRRETGRGVGSSGLRFDQIEPFTPSNEG